MGGGNKTRGQRGPWQTPGHYRAFSWQHLLMSLFAVICRDTDNLLLLGSAWDPCQEHGKDVKPGRVTMELCDPILRNWHLDLPISDLTTKLKVVPSLELGFGFV